MTLVAVAFSLNAAAYVDAVLYAINYTDVIRITFTYCQIKATVQPSGVEMTCGCADEENFKRFSAIRRKSCRCVLQSKNLCGGISLECTFWAMHKLGPWKTHNFSVPSHRGTVRADANEAWEIDLWFIYHKHFKVELIGLLYRAWNKAGGSRAFSAVAIALFKWLPHVTTVPDTEPSVHHEHYNPIEWKTD